MALCDSIRTLPKNLWNCGCLKGHVKAVNNLREQTVEVQRAELRGEITGSNGMKLREIKHELGIRSVFIQDLDLFKCEIDSQGKESITSVI